MKKGTKTLQQSIASNKFYPPRINRSQSLQRHNIITDRLASATSAKKIIIIEAQAGQGKTTLAYQYLDHAGHPFIWYQIGPEDIDPILFLAALHFSLSKSFSTFSSPHLAAILEEGQIGPTDFKECVNLLLHDIDSTIEDDIFIAFDDLHLISESQYTNLLLDYIIDTAPPRLHFILTSRQPLDLQARLLTRTSMPLYLDTEDLALGLQDIESLYEIIFSTSLTRKEAENILKQTNGWVMGIILAAHPYANKRARKTSEAPAEDWSRLISGKIDASILSYFEEEIFSHLPEHLRNDFLKLSFIDEIDISLARILTAIDDIDQHLGRMADENFFVYRLDDDNSVFRLHHLFQEFLQINGRTVYSDNEINEIYNRAADYYLTEGLVEKALKSLCSGRDYSRMEQVMKHWGLRLVAGNRTITILAILQSVEEEILLKHTWLTFFHGLLSTDTNPRQTLPYFEACRTQFAQNNDEAGELMSLSQIIYFHFVISGQYRLGSMLLKRTQTLFERNHRNLPDEIIIIVARNLAAGYCFFEGKMEQAHHYATRGYELAKKRESGNFIAATRFILGYIALLSGNRRAARHEIENSLHLAHDPLVGMSNRLTLHIMQLCDLSMHGDSVAFSYQKQLIQSSVDETITRQTVAAPYLFIWSALALIAEGNLKQALATLEQGMMVSKSASSDHMTSQFLQWRAFAHSLTGRSEQALKDIETSTSLRNESGGPFYMAYNYAIAGASLVTLELYDKATGFLEKGLTIAQEIPSPYIEVCCRAYLALISCRKENDEHSLEKVGDWLNLMKKHDFSYFWGWEPEAAKQLLETALKHGIHPEFSRSCAGKNGIIISVDGTGVAPLDISILGNFSVGVKGEKSLALKDFSALQRELLGLLISSSDFSVSQEQVQLAFWPDTPPDKARNNLDTLTHRFRKLLKDKLQVAPPSYFIVEKGFLRLINVRVDAIDCMTCADHGLKLAGQSLWWQAGNTFTRAFSLWKNHTLEEFFINDQALKLYDEILEAMRRFSICWSGMLIKYHRYNEALSILEKSSEILPHDDDCIALRYHLCIKNNTPLKARDILTAYRQELLKIGYSDIEIDEMISDLINRKLL
ncbi:MAG: hypothetical protein V2I35_06565 [Desulfocapsaceae bacterium]|jgi:ATP/maltotriose-dependent transcriptional regulator MalT|nr:hypothetical protein [Desulfocapsaceae bacterium]